PSSVQVFSRAATLILRRILAGGNAEADPGRQVDSDGDAAGCDRLALAEGLTDPVEPHQRKPALARHRADISDHRLARLDVSAGLQRLDAIERHHALARRRAVLHARDDLLADIAAFLEADPAELIEQRLVRKGVAQHVIPAALRHAERDAVRVVLLRVHDIGRADT